MFKPNKLLKVVSIIMIIAGALGLISSIAGVIMLGNSTVMDAMKNSGVEVTAIDYVLPIISSVLELTAGIVGVRGKSAKLCYGVEGCDLLVIIVSVAMTVVKTGFMWTIIFSFILPVLYLWGVYQSQE